MGVSLETSLVSWRPDDFAEMLRLNQLTSTCLEGFCTGQLGVGTGALVGAFVFLPLFYFLVYLCLFIFAIFVFLLLYFLFICAYLIIVMMIYCYSYCQPPSPGRSTETGWGAALTQTEL